MRGAPYAFGPSDIDPIARGLRSAREGVAPGNSAVVATEDATYGRARQLCTHAGFLNHNAEAFRSMAEATEWLSAQVAQRPTE